MKRENAAVTATFHSVCLWVMINEPEVGIMEAKGRLVLERMVFSHLGSYSKDYLEGKIGLSGAYSKGFDGLEATRRVIPSGGWPKTTMLKYAYLSYKTFERKSQPQNAYTCRVLHGFYMNTIKKKIAACTLYQKNLQNCNCFENRF